MQELRAKSLYYLWQQILQPLVSKPIKRFINCLLNFSGESCYCCMLGKRPKVVPKLWKSFELYQKNEQFGHFYIHPLRCPWCLQWDTDKGVTDTVGSTDDSITGRYIIRLWWYSLLVPELRLPQTCKHNPCEHNEVISTCKNTSKISILICCTRLEVGC